MGNKIIHITPSEHLRPYIKYYKYMETDLYQGRYKSIAAPDVEMYFNFIPIKMDLQRCTIQDPKIFIAGLQDIYKETYCCSYGTGKKSGFAIVFKVLGFFHLFGIKISDLADYVISAQDIFGAYLNHVWEQLDPINDPYEMKRIVERCLLKYIHCAANKNALINNIFDLINDKNGMLSTGQICSYFHITPRKLQRWIRRETGFTTKEILQTYRINHVLKHLTNLSYSSLTKLGYYCGYYDQSHFIKDFKKLTGKSPGRLFSDKENTILRQANRYFITANE